MKRILILGGADIHCKLIRAAKEMGVFTIVTDYLSREESPGKRIADKSYDINIFDLDALEDLCRRERVDGVLSTSLDPCQRPYQTLCERLGLPCYCENGQQVFQLTDKSAFKKLCAENGVDTIPTYEEDSPDIVFPVLVKPAISRGSKGISICQNRAQLSQAVLSARERSENGEALIEKYMGNKNDFTVELFFLDGQPYLLRVGDRFLGSRESGMDRNCIASVYPSRYAGLYMKNVHKRLTAMLQGIGIKNGPCFFQGFVDGETIRFYDPGFRFPGAEYETMLKEIFGIDFMKIMVGFAITGKMDTGGAVLSDDIAFLDHKTAGMWLPAIREGVIGGISGFDQIGSIPGVCCFTVRHRIGDKVEKTDDVRQLLCEVDMYCDSLEEYKRTLREVQSRIRVLDVQGEDMMISPFDPEEIKATAWTAQEEGGRHLT